jgi:hypothetical protein
VGVEVQKLNLRFKNSDYVTHNLCVCGGYSAVVFTIPYAYGFITTLCIAHTDVILNGVNPNVRGIGQGEAWHNKYKRLKLGDVWPTTVQLTAISV